MLGFYYRMEAFEKTYCYRGDEILNFVVSHSQLFVANVNVE